MSALQLATLHPWSPRSIGAHAVTFDFQGLGQVDTGTAWPTANRAFFVPFELDGPLDVTKLWACIDSAAGNLDIGIYDWALTRLVSTGSTAMSGSSALQVITVTATRLGPGQYFMALGCSSTSAGIAGGTPAAEDLRHCGVFQQDSAVALPATATPAAMASAFLPLFGLGTKWMT